MDSYQNQSGASPIASFEAGPNLIDVHFKGDGTYRYSYAKPGRTHVEYMKILARQGAGLASYISRYVQDSYDTKWE